MKGIYRLFALLVCLATAAALGSSAHALDESKVHYIGPEADYAQFIQQYFEDNIDNPYCDFITDSGETLFSRLGGLYGSHIQWYTDYKGVSYAILQQQDRYRYIDAQGNLLFPDYFDNAGEFRGDYAWVEKDGREYYIGRSGQEISMQFEELRFDTLGYRITIDNLDGFADENLQWILPPIYDSVCSSDGGFLVALQGKHRALFDNTGKQLTDFLFTEVCTFSPTLVFVKVQDQWQQYDLAANRVLPAVYDTIASPYGDNTALLPVSKDGKHGFIDHTGSLVVPLIYDMAYDFYKGYAQIALGNLSGYIDATGTVAVPLTYNWLRFLENGYFIAQKDGLYGVIDMQNNTVIPFIYEDIDADDSGYFQVKKDGKWGILDSNNQEVYPLTVQTRFLPSPKSHYPPQSGDYLQALKNGISIYRSNDKTGAIIPNGTWLEPIYDSVYMNNFAIYAWQDNTCRFFDLNGKPLVTFTDQNNFPSFTFVHRNGRLGWVLKEDLDIYADVNWGDAMPGTSKLLYNGTPQVLDAYVIRDSNYIKLRDFAAMLSGSNKQVDVVWDEAKNTISLFRGKPYTPVGGELTQTDKIPETALVARSTLLLDGQPIDIKAYQIGDNNYLKLRDVMALLDVFVGWDGTTSTVTLDTSRGYVAP